MPGTNGGPEPDEGYGRSAYSDEPYVPPPDRDGATPEVGCVDCGRTATHFLRRGAAPGLDLCATHYDMRRAEGIDPEPFVRDEPYEPPKDRTPDGADTGADRGQQWTNGADTGAEGAGQGAEVADIPEPDRYLTIERVEGGYKVRQPDPEDPERTAYMILIFRDFRPGEYRKTKAEVSVSIWSWEAKESVTFLDDILLDHIPSQERLAERIDRIEHQPSTARWDTAAVVREADRLVREARADGLKEDTPEDGGMVWLGLVPARPPQQLLLDMVDAGGAFTIANAHGGAGKGLTGCWLVQKALASGIVPAILDFEGRPEEWVTRMNSLGIDVERVAYISRDRLPMRLRGLSLLDPHLADHLLSEMQRMGIGFYIADNIITALLAGEEEMKSDPQVPWKYREVVERWGIPGISFAHPPRGRTDGDPFGSSMWQAASRFLWHGTAAAGGEQQEHHVRWRLHKANTKRKAEPFLLVTTFTDDLPVRIESRLDSASTRDWLMSVMGVKDWSVEDLVEVMLLDDDDPSPVRREQAKERIGKALRRERDKGFETVGHSQRGASARWRIKTSGWVP